MKNKKTNITYGKKLKDARVSVGLTQEKVAEFLGLAPRYVSDLERDKTKGSIDTLIKLCNIYNITPNDLLDKYIFFKIPKSDIQLSGFYSLTKEHQDIILNLIKYFNQEQEK